MCVCFGIVCVFVCYHSAFVWNSVYVFFCTFSLVLMFRSVSVCFVCFCEEKKTVRKPFHPYADCIRLWDLYLEQTVHLIQIEISFLCHRIAFCIVFVFFLDFLGVVSLYNSRGQYLRNLVDLSSVNLQVCTSRTRQDINMKIGTNILQESVNKLKHYDLWPQWNLNITSCEN